MEEKKRSKQKEKKNKQRKSDGRLAKCDYEQKLFDQKFATHS